LNDQQGIDLAKACLKVARDAGVNLFDNAETYGNPTGEAERIMGVAISQLREEDPEKWRRSDIIITTKVPSLPPTLSSLSPSRRSSGVAMGSTRKDCHGNIFVKDWLRLSLACSSIMSIFSSAIVQILSPQLRLLSVP
jgi:hypothetical protein